MQIPLWLSEIASPPCRLAFVIALFACQNVEVRAESCDQPAFAKVVAEANANLTGLNEQNKNVFQEKLQALRTREGWSEADFPAKAMPFVKDETIAAFDAKSEALLAQISQLGGDGNTASEEKRCGMLESLKGIMGQLVETTSQKWRHMFDKLDGALNASAAAAMGK